MSIEDKVFGFLGLKLESIGGFDENSLINTWVKFSIRSMVSHLTRLHSPITFLCGGQPGVEKWAAEEVLNVKSCHPDRNIRLVMVMPFPDMTGRSSDGQPISNRPWPLGSHESLMTLLGRADEVTVLSQGPYAAWRIRARDEWVIDNSSGLLAICGEDEKDTQMAGNIRYAKEKCSQILFIDPSKETIYLS